MHKIYSLFLVFITINLSVSCSSNVKAPTPTARAINQNKVHKNGCGISSLINAYRFASPKWQAASRKIAGSTDREQFNFIAKNYGRTNSRYSPGTRRWEDRSGISSIDLKDLANDFQNKQNLGLPNLRITTHYIQGNESSSVLLKRTHSHLRNALASGFPPIISIKHVAGSKIEGHIVVLYELPSQISGNAMSFPIKYLDPLGGIVKTGVIKVASSSASSEQLKLNRPRTLTMDLPQSDIAKRNGSTGDSIVLSASIAP